MGENSSQRSLSIPSLKQEHWGRSDGKKILDA